MIEALPTPHIVMHLPPALCTDFSATCNTLAIRAEAPTPIVEFATAMFSDIERKRAKRAIDKLLKPRLAPHVKSGGVLRLSCRGQSFELSSHMTGYSSDAVDVIVPIAKFRFVRTSAVWQLLWPRASGKWQCYEPLPYAVDLATLVEEVWLDPNHCFWG